MAEIIQKEEITEDERHDKERLHEEQIGRSKFSQEEGVKQLEEKLENVKLTLSKELTNGQLLISNVTQKMDDDSTDNKEDINQLNSRLTRLEDKFEAFTALITIQRDDDMESVEELPVQIFETGRCILETSADCDSQKLLLLPCLHNVCQPCVDQHKDKSIVCKCGQEIGLEKDKLPIDYVQHNKARIAKRNYNCDYLQPPCLKEAESYCTQCDVSLCADCQKNHDLIRVNSIHEVIASEKIAEHPPWKSPKSFSCVHHPGQQLIYMDKDCNKAICNVCYKGPHSGHDLAALDKEYEARKDSLAKALVQQGDCLGKLRQCLKQKRDHLHTLHQNQDQLKQELATTHAKITMTYLEQLKARQQKMEDENKVIQKTLLKDIKLLCEREAALVRTLDYADSSTEFTSQAEFLELSESILSKASGNLKSLDIDDSALENVGASFCGHREVAQLGKMSRDARYKGTPDVQPTPTETQMECEHLQTDDVYPKTDVSRLRQVIDFLIEPARKQGFHFLDPQKLEKSFILQCTDLAYNENKVNQKYAHINTEGDLQNRGSILARFAGQRQRRLQRYCGTCSTVPLSRTGCPQYLEVVSRICLDKVLDGGVLIMEIGLASEEEQDQSHWIGDSPYSYSMAVSHCKKHNNICRVICSQKKYVHCLLDTFPNTVWMDVTLLYGIVFDDTRSRIAFLDIKEKKIAAILDIADSSQDMFPMFGVYNPENVSVTMKVIAGKAIDVTQDKKDLILEALA